MTSPRQLLESHGLFPKKALGQNFLFDPNSLQKIVGIAEVRPEDTVLEIGTGTGSLTRLLADHAQQVHTVEVDDRLVPILRDQLAGYGNIQQHWQDILTLDLGKVLGKQPFKVVANLPYYITSAILRKLLEGQPKPTSLTVMMQKQVAERLAAKPNDMSILAVSVQFYGDPKTRMTLKPSVFYPRPDVDSSVVQMTVDPTPRYDVPSEGLFFEVVRAGFGQKRKQLKNSLASGLHLSDEVTAALLHQAGIEGQRRAETLTLEEWASLSRIYGNMSHAT
jgi:16S rRNA (adenine1518-N6/adenine1519-N6)-dimethyltransferase